MTDIWLLDVGDGGTGTSPLVNTAATEGEAAFSPVADFVAYVSDESGAPEVWLRSYPTGAGGSAQLVSSGGGTGPLWSLDGRRLYYHSSRGLVAVDVAYEPALRLGQPRLVLDDPSLRVCDVAPDGRFLAVQSEPLPQITYLDVVLGFDRLIEGE